jgi:hypothetical protein
LTGKPLFPELEQADDDRDIFAPTLPPADFLRAHGWTQAYFPAMQDGPDDIPKYAKVWAHPEDAPNPVTFRDALWLARYPLRRLT